MNVLCFLFCLAGVSPVSTMRITKWTKIPTKRNKKNREIIAKVR